MRRGPKPEAAVVKVAKGNPSRRPIGLDPEAGPSAPAVKVAPPAWLKKEGLAAWNRLAPRLIQLRLLTVNDAETFARYCRNFARWLKMQTELDREGEHYESESAHGKLKRVHPAFMIADRLERMLLAAEANFGLNPAERQRLFAARAALPTGASDLFGDPGVTPAQPTPATQPANPHRGPIGFLQ